MIPHSTGVPKNQICVRNGNAYGMSRYRTFRADSHSPTPKAVRSASSRKTGITTACQCGVRPYQTNIPTSTQNASRKSSTGAKTAARGIKSRGNQTFVIRFWLPTMLMLDAPRQDWKYIHGSSAV